MPVGRKMSYFSFENDGTGIAYLRYVSKSIYVTGYFCVILGLKQGETVYLCLKQVANKSQLNCMP